MKVRSRKYRTSIEKIDTTRLYDVEEALDMVTKTAFAQFDESVDLAFRLGVDPRHADQMIRGAMPLPAGVGKKLKSQSLPPETKSLKHKVPEQIMWEKMILFKRLRGDGWILIGLSPLLML